MLVGVVAEDEPRRTARVSIYEADIEAGVEEGLTEEDHVIISRRSANGRKLFSGRLEEEDDLGDEGDSCGKAGTHRDKDRGKRGVYMEIEVSGGG